ncbi:hypothetical protein BDV26DRAFT_239808 [Aspergillus bertholletiae]|uniref:Uncharacterized protein n=1 Tax=Aspergillus bertholletiae TaxID=1226010 RepID=A0A5N7B5C6_9EURO|nr:hypothetical protein BDV26DRAFT_239808 [Aspergillus bertholletiae]
MIILLWITIIIIEIIFGLVWFAFLFLPSISLSLSLSSRTVIGNRGYHGEEDMEALAAVNGTKRLGFNPTGSHGASFIAVLFVPGEKR